MHTQNLIIGFGKAGKTLAADLAQHGQSVVLVEQDEQMYGGTCINIGCIPSKKLLAEGAKHHDFQAAMQAKNTLIPKLRAANFAKLDNMANVQIIHAQAQFQDEHNVILRSAAGEQTIHAERIFINTGAASNPLNIAGANSPRVYYSSEMLSLAQRPARLVIIGGGYISLEFAFMYQQFGSQVTILDNSPVFLPREDRDSRATACWCKPTKATLPPMPCWWRLDGIPTPPRSRWKTQASPPPSAALSPPMPNAA